MERLWIKVPGYRVHNISRESYGLGHVYLDVRLGNVLVIRRVQVESINRGEGKPLFSQNWAMTKVHFLDVPKYHEHTTKKTPLLKDVLDIALEDCYDELAQALDGDLQKIELEYVRPKGWNGKSLRIPVDFVRFSGFVCNDPGGRVYANIQFGHHFVAQGMEIYDGKKFGLDLGGHVEILDMGLRRLVYELLRRRSVRKAIADISKEGKIAFGKEFIMAAKGCNPSPDAIPPAIRFY